MQTIGYELKTKRIENGMTQKELCSLAGVGLNAVINLESGKNVSPTTIKKVRTALQY